MFFLAALAPTWSIVLGGDIMLNGVSPRSNPLAQISPELHSGNLAFANLEVPLTGVGSPTQRKSAAELRARSQFVLRGNPAQIHWLPASGIRAVSLGNNHAMDYGPTALAREIDALDSAGVKHAGAGMNQDLAKSVTVITLSNGIRVGLISGLAFNGAGALYKCTPATRESAGVNGLFFGGKPSAEKLGHWVRTAHKRCDVLIVALHGGIERQPFPTSYQVNLAHAFIDAGADVVWGHHPHVLEGAELYRGKPILYSMGNLVSPTPAVSGLIKLTFSGTEWQRARFLPIAIRAGHAVPDPRADQRTAAFRRLCDQTAAKLHRQPLPL